MSALAKFATELVEGGDRQQKAEFLRGQLRIAGGVHIDDVVTLPDDKGVEVNLGGVAVRVPTQPSAAGEAADPPPVADGVDVNLVAVSVPTSAAGEAVARANAAVKVVRQKYGQAEAARDLLSSAQEAATKATELWKLGEDEATKVLGLANEAIRLTVTLRPRMDRSSETEAAAPSAAAPVAVRVPTQPSAAGEAVARANAAEAAAPSAAAPVVTLRPSGAVGKIFDGLDVSENTREDPKRLIEELKRLRDNGSFATFKLKFVQSATRHVLGATAGLADQMRSLPKPTQIRFFRDLHSSLIAKSNDTIITFSNPCDLHSNSIAQVCKSIQDLTPDSDGRFVYTDGSIIRLKKSAIPSTTTDEELGDALTILFDAQDGASWTIKREAAGDDQIAATLQSGTRTGVFRGLTETIQAYPVPVASLVGMLLLLGLGIYVKVQSQSSSGEQPFRLSDNDTSGNVTARDIEEYAQRELFAADWSVLLLNRLGPLSLTA